LCAFGRALLVITVGEAFRAAVTKLLSAHRPSPCKRSQENCRVDGLGFPQGLPRDRITNKLNYLRCAEAWFCLSYLAVCLRNELKNMKSGMPKKWVMPIDRMAVRTRKIVNARRGQRSISLSQPKT
jgi:hypothetical protein